MNFSDRDVRNFPVSQQVLPVRRHRSEILGAQRRELTVRSEPRGHDNAIRLYGITTMRAIRDTFNQRETPRRPSMRGTFLPFSVSSPGSMLAS